MIGSGTCCMKEKQGFIAEYRKGEATMSSLCRRFMISRKTGYQWVRRFEGPGGWDGQARRGGRRPWVITPAVAEAILNLRAQYPLEGPKKLVVRLTRQERRRPSASAIGEFLRRNGLVAKRRRRRHPAPMSQPFAEVIEPNDLMTVDRKGWFRTGNHQKCEPLTVMDQRQPLPVVQPPPQASQLSEGARYFRAAVSAARTAQGDSH